jgi:hypothetical protein
MNACGRIRGHKVPMAAAKVPAPASRPSAGQYISDLQLKLAISDSQMEVWQPFVESLRANRRRMQALDNTTDQPFGCLEDRLSARDAMRRAVTKLFTALDKLQQQTAMQVLPLCCLPYPAHAWDPRPPADVSPQ